MKYDMICKPIMDGSQQKLGAASFKGTILYKIDYISQLWSIAITSKTYVIESNY